MLLINSKIAQSVSGEILNTASCGSLPDTWNHKPEVIQNSAKNVSVSDSNPDVNKVSDNLKNISIQVNSYTNEKTVSFQVEQKKRARIQPS